MGSRWRTTATAALSSIALVTACSGTVATSTTTSTEIIPEPTVRESTPAPSEVAAEETVIDSTFLVEQAEKSWDSSKPGAVMVAVYDSSGNVVHGSVGTSPSGNAPTPDDSYRIGSITKLFTALTVLTFVDEGVLDLDAPLSGYVTRVPLDGSITVRNALEHSSGLPDYGASPGFEGALFDEPTRVWTPEEAVGLTTGNDLDFEPGMAIEYSNTNYAVLGILIEEISGLPYHEVVRSRILEPVGLQKTYLAGFEAGAEPFGGFISFLNEVAPIDFDFTSFATASWASGAMVSTGADLHALLQALFAGEIISEELLSEMTAGPYPEFGLGSVQWTSETPLYGHDGRIPGSGTWLVHAPETGMTVFTVSNSNHLKVSPATGPVAELIGMTGISLDHG